MDIEGTVNNLKSTWPRKDALGSVAVDLGYFATVLDFGGLGIAITTDGIGTKAIVAHQVGKYNTVGIDCVAMNVNDLLCVGATPVSMVDYVAVEFNDFPLHELCQGIIAGANLAGISVSGGETAILPGVIKGFDLAGTAIGHVPIDKILIGQNIREGDLLIGVESSGIHSNGLTLARRALNGSFDAERNLLLKPTSIYVREALKVRDELGQSLKAFFHITGDGLFNLVRSQAAVGYVIDRLPDIPEIFKIIQHCGQVNDSEMFATFNMGIGFAAVVSPGAAPLALELFRSEGKKAWVLGFAFHDERRQIHLEQFRLTGEDKRFQ